MRVLVTAGPVAGRDADEVRAGVAAAWHRAAPGDRLDLAPGLPPHLDRRVADADLVLVVTDTFDADSLRPGSVVTAVAGVATSHGVPCVVLAGDISVGRREAAAAGVEAALATGTPAGDAGPRGLEEAVARLARQWSRPGG